MATPVVNPRWREVEDFIEAYESAQVRQGRASLRTYLPPREHPSYARIVQELIRVDLEYAWQRGDRKLLEEYRSQFPEVFADLPTLTEIAYEEYRLRRQAGESPSRQEYEERYGINTNLWPRPSQVALVPMLDDEPQPTISPSQLDLRRPQQVPSDMVNLAPSPVPDAPPFLPEGRLDQGMPRPGTQYQGFHIVELLGKGAFSRVFLAQQTDLANRFVVLKIATDIMGETQNLAQLQHTNIVPIFSLHQADRHQVVCMPYFGAITISDLLDDLKARAIVPDSGKKLLSTLNDRKQKTIRSRLPGSSTPSKQGSDPTGSSLSLQVNRLARLAAEPPAATLKLLEGYSYVQVIIWMAVRLADALAHAHERGIYHRDIKPANILISDDGQPMLLDFNLSVDVKSRGNAQAAFIGGTLPYMAPEHMEAFQGHKRNVDARSDIYSLGVVLCELLTLRHPFPVHSGPVNTMLPRLLQDRAGAPPQLRIWNPSVSPAVEAIIRKCMEPKPQKRYQSAKDLREDLERHLNDLPLQHAKEPSRRERFRKWRRRHPKLTSATTMALLAGFLLLSLGAAFFVHSQRTARLEAKVSQVQLQEDLKNIERHLVGAPNTAASREQAQHVCRQVMSRYQLDRPDWQKTTLLSALEDGDRERVRTQLSIMLFHYAEASAFQANQEKQPERRKELAQAALKVNEVARSVAPETQQNRALWLQAQILLQLAEEPAAATDMKGKVASLQDRTAADHYQMGALLFGLHRYREAAEHLHAATKMDANNFAAWFLLGRCQFELGQQADALISYNTCLALRDDAFLAYLYRGIMYNELEKPDEALTDFARTLELKPDLYAEVLLNRARAKELKRDYTGALQDVTAALDKEVGGTRLLFWRAKIRLQLARIALAARNHEPWLVALLLHAYALGQQGEAALDQLEGKRRTPTDEASWTARGEFRAAREPEEALRDFEQALLLNPHFRNALQGKANVLSEGLKSDATAIEVLDQLVALYPHYEKALAGRGVLLARLGKREAAHADARRLLELGPREPISLYQVADIYALTSLQVPSDRYLAFQYLAQALGRAPNLLQLLPRDSDLAPLRDETLFQQLVRTLQTIQRAAAQEK
jgi:serine/threonine protein kinase/tetratricopeptide (TPR) repeat protein